MGIRIRVMNKTKEGVTFKYIGLKERFGTPRDTATWE